MQHVKAQRLLKLRLLPLRPSAACPSRIPALHPALRRTLHASVIRRDVPYLLISELVVGLPLALWTVKCTALVLGQRKIIFMPYFPPGARSETVKDYSSELAGLSLREVEIRSERTIRLRGIELQKETKTPRVIYIYLQGNASTPLARIPIFRKLLMYASAAPLDLAILAVGPRSYWRSTRRRPTQRGLTEDYLAVVRWARAQYPDARIVVHGHSIGASLAIQVIARLEKQVDGLILECCFTSIPDMVKAMYPHKLIPYRYLGPFAFDRMDTIAAIKRTDVARLPLLSLISENDELVPRELSERVHEAFGGNDKRLAIVRGAFHENGFQQRAWTVEVLSFIRTIQDQADDAPSAT